MNGGVDKIWLDSYTEGVPAQIDAERYASLVELLQDSVARFGERPAFANMGKTLSFDALDVLTRDFAAFLQSRLGLEKGDRFAIMMPNLLQYPVALFGALRAGLAVVNVNPLYTPRELRHQLTDSGTSPAWKSAIGAAALWSVAAASLGAVQPWTKFRYFFHQRPDALIANPAVVPPTWPQHLYDQWVHVSTFKQSYDQERYYLWFEDILHRHGKLRTREWTGFSEAEAEAWIRDGIADLQPIVDLLDGSGDHRGSARAIGHFWLAKMHHRLGERIEATRECDRCLGLAPDYGPARKLRATLDAE